MTLMKKRRLKHPLTSQIYPVEDGNSMTLKKKRRLKLEGEGGYIGLVTGFNDSEEEKIETNNLGLLS